MKLMSARDSRAPAPIRTAKRAPEIFVAALEVEDAERRAEVPVRLRLEVERARLADAADLDVVGGARARPARARAAGSAASAAALRRSSSTASSSASSCLICWPRARLAAKIGARVVPLPLGARDLVARRVLLALEPLDLAGSAARRRASSVGELLEVGVGVDAAVAEAGADERPGGRGRRRDRAWRESYAIRDAGMPFAAARSSDTMHPERDRP